MVEIVRDGVLLHYVDRGTGFPLLFHTGGGGDRAMWESAGYRDVLPGYRHLLLDPRGHGLSGQPMRPQAHRVPEYVSDVVAVLDAVGVERVGFVGYSDGAHIAFALAADHPERVAAIVAIGAVSTTTPSADDRSRKAAEVRTVGLRSWLQRAAAAEREPPPAWLMDNLASTPTEVFALKVEAWSDALPDAAYFPRIQAPTLIVYGEDEDPDRSTETAAARLGNGRVVAVPRCGHLGVFWRTDLTATSIAQFLRDATAPNEHAL